MTQVCPKCNKDDQIRKLTSIAGTDVSRGSFSGFSGGTVNVGNNWGSYGGSTYLHGSSMTDLASLIYPPPKPSLDDKVWLRALGIGLGILVPYAWPVLAYYMLSKKENAKRIQKREEALRKLEEATKEWEKGMQIFIRAYYCYRDDLCFDPKSSLNWSPVETRSLFGKNVPMLEGKKETKTKKRRKS